LLGALTLQASSLDKSLSSRGGVLVHKLSLLDLSQVPISISAFGRPIFFISAVGILFVMMVFVIMVIVMMRWMAHVVDPMVVPAVHALLFFHEELIANALINFFTPVVPSVAALVFNHAQSVFADRVLDGGGQTGWVVVSDFSVPFLGAWRLLVFVKRIGAIPVVIMVVEHLFEIGAPGIFMSPFLHPFLVAIRRLTTCHCFHLARISRINPQMVSLLFPGFMIPNWHNAPVLAWSKMVRSGFLWHIMLTYEVRGFINERGGHLCSVITIIILTSKFVATVHQGFCDSFGIRYERHNYVFEEHAV